MSTIAEMLDRNPGLHGPLGALRPDYKEVIDQFLVDCCEATGTAVQNSDLYAAYRRFAGAGAASHRRFTQHLLLHGFVQRRDGKGRRWPQISLGAWAVLGSSGQFKS